MNLIRDIASLAASVALCLAGIPSLAHAQSSSLSVLQSPTVPSDVVWTGTWSAPMLTLQLANGDGSPNTLARQTVRQSFRSSIAGTMIRVQLSNIFGLQPVTLSDVHFAKAASDQAIVSGTDKALTFGGFASVTIPAGQSVESDAIAYNVAASTDYAVSMFVPNAIDPQNVTAHRQAWQHIYFAAGDVSGISTIATTGSVDSYLYLTGVDVVNSAATGAVVALGASITDGSNTTFGANLRWVNDLALRLQAAGLQVGVLAAGLSGGHLLDDQDFGGPSALNRFNRDVISKAGVKWVISSDTAINDLSSHADGTGPTAAQLIAATQQLIDEAHSSGLKFLCSTLTPNVGRPADQWSDGAEAIREQLNTFYKSADSHCDGIVDQDTATHDPQMPLQYRPSFNSGDFLHPNDPGTQAIANAVNLGFFTPTGLPPIKAPTQCGSLLPGEGITPNQHIVSCDGRFQLLLQTDSNLVLSFGKTVLWSSNTAGKNAAEFTFLADGNVVLLDTTGKVIFQTNTAGLLGTTYIVQNDGNVVLYDGPVGGPNNPIYNTGTCCH
ncbi:SGNH/GDSL hydrolase family protein [Granulicella sp. dw_53]|uniref:SGNH/GDSL hydrolase family protein n=1 Tax=Granulicella sp. dw_53 TaxID=2719792 RepID=UPI0021021D2B|nr:SGNH/GDSL hydrolase family protein [Granulicella sp. dw_53]